MKIRLQDGLPYVIVSITHHGQQLALEDVLLDTGSVGTIFPTDKVLAIGLQYEADDIIEIDGIIGMNFLTQIGAVVDLAKLEVYQAPPLKTRGESP